MGTGARSEDSIASLLLTTRLGDAVPAPLTPSRYWRLLDAVPEPAELLGVAGGDLARRAGLSPEDGLQIERLLAGATTLAFALERMERQGFVPLTAFDEGYPARLRERLGDQAPPVLFTVGDRALLSSEGIGIVGSRAVTPDGAEVARAVAGRAAAEGLTVVSGGARGVDQEAMSAAQTAGGRVVAYLADSLQRRVREPETRRAVAEGVVCLATPHGPSAGFSAANAVGRNKLDLRRRADDLGRRERSRARGHLGGSHRGARARLRDRRGLGRPRQRAGEREARGARRDPRLRRGGGLRRPGYAGGGARRIRPAPARSLADRVRTQRRILAT